MNAMYVSVFSLAMLGVSACSSSNRANGTGNPTRQVASSFTNGSIVFKTGNAFLSSATKLLSVNTEANGSDNGQAAETIRQYADNVLSQMPVSGAVSEFNTAALYAFALVAGRIAKVYVRTNLPATGAGAAGTPLSVIPAAAGDYTMAKHIEVYGELMNLLRGRSPNAEEKALAGKHYMDVLGGATPTSATRGLAVTSLLTGLLTSLDFLIQ